MFKRIHFNLSNNLIFKTTSLMARVLTSKSDLDIQTFVFLDIETTGLPFQEGNKTKITELCLVAVQADHISLGVLPRVLNKLNFCFNPIKTIAPICKEITGLSNELLQYQPEFQDTVEIIKSFLALQRKPLCLVAHNGNKFDYPILQAEIFNAGSSLLDDILCIDSLRAFRELEHQISVEEHDIFDLSTKVKVPVEFTDGFDELLLNVVEELEASECQINKVQKKNETTPVKKVKSFITDAEDTTNISDAYYMPNVQAKNCSGAEGEENKKQSSNLNLGKSVSSHFRRQSFKLSEVYARLTNKEPTEAHKAEYDCSMLIECTVKIGERFTDWANVNAKKLSDIPMMKPKQKLEY